MSVSVIKRANRFKLGMSDSAFCYGRQCSVVAEVGLIFQELEAA